MTEPISDEELMMLDQSGKYPRFIARIDLERNRADRLEGQRNEWMVRAGESSQEALAGYMRVQEEMADKVYAAKAEVARLRGEVEAAKQNTRRMAMLAEMFVYEPNRISEGGLLAQVQRALTDQDVEYDG